jgi:hypothetical protein
MGRAAEFSAVAAGRIPDDHRVGLCAALARTAQQTRFADAWRAMDIDDRLGQLLVARQHIHVVCYTLQYRTARVWGGGHSLLVHGISTLCVMRIAYADSTYEYNNKN